jgi:hypothetical protein
LTDFVSAVRLINEAGIGPSIFSINAKCSIFSWVSKSWRPKCNSARRHPTLHRSSGQDHPSPVESHFAFWNILLRTISGAEYCLVPTTLVWERSL